MSISGEKIVSRIDKILEEKNQLSRADACRYAKINVRAMTDWTTKGTIPAADTLYLVAEFLGSTVEYLLTGKDNEGFSQNERDLVIDFRSLSGDNKRNIRVLIDSMLTAPAEGEKGKQVVRKAAG
jgi:transcriptional regulator with XRE-family HTH domain